MSMQPVQQPGSACAYFALGTGDGYEDDEETDENELPVHEEEVLIHVNPENSRGNWNHIQDLDDFFTRVYSYHQRGGYICMILEDVFHLLQFAFVAVFAYFLTHCVSYPILFHDVENVTIHKINLDDAFLTTEECLAGLGSTWMVLLTVIFIVIILCRICMVAYSVSRYLHIRSFYHGALKIETSELPNMTWHEVQGRLLEVQKEHQMCVHKKELTQLDIYHRILRFKNYMVAMVNINTLPFKFSLPFIGEYAYLSMAYRYNIEAILFTWPGAPFENSWHLRNEYKSFRNKEQLIKELDKRIFMFGMANLIFSPLIFFYNFVYCFFRYVELFKRHPGFFGLRKWSTYAKFYLRHFNELDHELEARMNKGYQPVSDYLKIFVSNIAVIVAKFVIFFAGAIVAVLVALTIYDEDVLSVGHVVAILTIGGTIISVCNGIIPNENTVHCPELLLRKVAMAIHYMPKDWAGRAHTVQTRNAFYMLFQYKLVYILEEVLSPIVTPFILLFWLRPQAGKVVDFLRSFTVEVVGVGDVCSFSLMDVKKHGNTEWQAVSTQTSVIVPPKKQQAENGKTEMSLLHFHLMNPEWKPDNEGSAFIYNVKSQVQREVQARSMLFTMGSAEPGTSMLASLGSSLLPTTVQQSGINYSAASPSAVVPPVSAHPPRLRGAVSRMEGPAFRHGNATSLFSSLHSSINSEMPMGDTVSATGSVHNSLFNFNTDRQVDNYTRELMTNDMNLAALYLQELNRRHRSGDFMSQEDYYRALWHSHDISSTSGGAAHSASAGGQTHGTMPGITEEGSADDELEMREAAEEGSADDEREVDTASLMRSPPLHTADSDSPPHTLTSSSPHRL